MKVTIADNLSIHAVTALEGLGLQVDSRPELNAADLSDAIVETNILIVRSTRVTAKASGLKGRTLGILGFGAIGQEVAKRALGLEMRVLVWSRSLSPERAEQFGVGHATSALDLAKRSEAVSIHLPVTPQTKYLVNQEFLAALKPGAILVNTARGELVDTEALQTAIEEKDLRVGLDVFEEEPGGSDSPFANVNLADAVTCTPHIGASTAQASEAIADEVVRIVTEFVRSGRPPGAVNLCRRSPATHHLVVRHRNRVGVLAGVLDALRAEGINVEEMQNTIFEGAQAACCTMLLDDTPSNQLLHEVGRDENILHLALEKEDID